MDNSKALSSGDVQGQKAGVSENGTTALESASKKYGAQSGAMVHTYKDSQDIAKYDAAYKIAYDMGKSGVNIDYALKSDAVSYLTESQRELAYEAGRAAATVSKTENVTDNNLKLGGNEYESENLRIRDGGKRNGSADSEGQVSAMEGGTGQTKSRKSTGKYADSEIARIVNEGREVTVESLGILGASKEHTVRLIESGKETASMKAARAEAKSHGVEVKFFVGDNLTIIGEDGEMISARGYIKGGVALVRADHPFYTAEQLTRHEIGHHLIEKGEIDLDAVRARLKEIVGEENIEWAAKAYADAYDGTNMTAEQIWEECVCDSLGDMNIFARQKDIGKVMGDILPAIKTAAESDAKSPTQPRGSPEAKMSRETVDASEDIDNLDKNSDERLLSKPYADTLIDSFGISKLGDYIHVQKKVFETIEAEGFFTDTVNRSRTDVNNESGMIIETNKSGIDETFNLHNYARIGRWKKLAKLAIVRRIPEIIQNGHMVKPNEKNMYGGPENNKRFAYIEHTLEVDGKYITVQLDIKKSPQKNKFWVHKIIDIKNVSDFPASTKNGTEAGQKTTADKKIISQKNDLSSGIDENNSSGGQYSRELDIDGQSITMQSVKDLREILKAHNIQGSERLSINQFTSEDIKKAEPWARKFYAELGTKSPFFRAWFGDWRAYDRSKIKTVTVENIDLADVVMQNGDYGNTDTGWTIHAGMTLRDETKHYARGEKVSFKALNDVKNILENAVLLDTEISVKDSNKKSPGTAFMHKLYAPILYKGKSYIAKINVEEYFDEGTSSVKRKGYHLTAIKIEAADGSYADFSTTAPRSDTASTEAVNRSLTDYSSATTPQVESASVDSIADLHGLVKIYDEKFSPKSVSPALLNEDGTPKVFYHGTDAKFTVFDPSEMQEREGSFFFAENREDAAAYGSNVYEVYLQADNLADYDNQPIEFYKLRNKRAQVEWLKGRGYDGWYADMDSGGWGEVSVFDNTQIKSATDNIGTFDGKNPDIHYSRELDFIDYLDGEAELYEYIESVDERPAVTDKEIRGRIKSEKALTNRQLLVTALESVSRHPKERAILESYRAALEPMAKAERRIADIDADLKALRKSGSDPKYLELLELEKKTLLAEIEYGDRQLLKLEATEALRGVVERERQRATEALAKQREENERKLKEQKAESTQTGTRRRILFLPLARQAVARFKSFRQRKKDTCRCPLRWRRRRDHLGTQSVPLHRCLQPFIQPSLFARLSSRGDCHSKKHSSSATGGEYFFSLSRGKPLLGSNLSANAKRTPVGVLLRWRRRRDLNSRDGNPPYTLSRGASSAS